MRSIFLGLLIGVACILPGASGGVLAVAFGLYQPALEALANLFRDPKRHLRFLAPLAAGGAAGVVIGAVWLADAMARHERLMLFLFTGMILGGIPNLLHQAHRHEPFRTGLLLTLLGGMLCALPLCLPGAAGAETAALSGLQAFAAGVLEGVGTVVPGISTSLILIRLGWYKAYLSAVSGLETGRLMLIAAGFAISALACLRAVQRLFEKQAAHALYGVLGFVLISAAAVFPGFTKGMLFWAEAAALAAGAAAVRLTERLDNNRGVTK